MARRFMDSCGYYDADGITKKWTGLSNPVAPTVAAAPEGRGPGNAIANITQAYDTGPFVTLDSQTTWTVGFALWIGSLPGGSGWLTRIGNSTGNTACWVQLNEAGTLSVGKNGGYATTDWLGTSTFALNTGSWFYIEAQFVIHETAGSITVRVDGTERISVSGVDTTGGLDEYSTIHVFATGHHTSGTFASYIRDIWINDAQTTDWQGLATTHTGFDGDRRIRVLLPEAPSGAYSEFTGSDEDQIDNYALVDENPTDTSDYVTSSTVGHRDSYNFQNVPDEAGSVGPLQLVLIAQKDYTDPRKIRGTARIDAVDYEADAEFGVSGSSHTLGTSWNGYRQIWEVQPVAGNAAWDKATVDAAEFGQKLTV